jgi:hypothetical protein
MPAIARKPNPRPTPKIFHATVLVTRVEQWWVEAETADQARELLAAGQGHHDAVGERVHVEFEAILDDAA